MRAQIVVLLVIFLAITALIGYIKPQIKELIYGCTSIEDQMQYNIESKNCEE